MKPSPKLLNNNSSHTAAIHNNMNNSCTNLHNHSKLPVKFIENETLKSNFETNKPSKLRLNNIQRKNEEEEEKIIENKSNFSPRKEAIPLKSPKKIEIMRKTDENFMMKSSSNSPLKKAMKPSRDLNDIEIDKESLMQLNRATNQFFSKKVKETIQNSMLFQKPNSSEKKNNISLDETTFSIKSMDFKDRSSFFTKEKEIGKNTVFSLKNLMDFFERNA